MACHSGRIFFYLAPQLHLSRQNSSYNPSGLFASRFCKLPWCPFLPGSSRIPFIGIGVAYLVMPCDEQPFASFLMLTQGFHSLVLVLLLLQTCGQTAFCILLMHTHIPLTPFSWGTPLEGISIWISTIKLLNLLCQSLFGSEVSHSCHGPIPGQHSSYKYRYKSFKCAFNKFKDPIQDISRLTYCSVRNFTSDAWPAQFTCFPLGIDALD